MTIFARELAPVLRRAARAFPIVVLTGPRRAGKTYCLRRTFPDASYHLLEDPDVISRVRADPRGFLDDLELPAILDEVQNVPELFAYVRSRVDGVPSRKGRFILTGSQDMSLMRGVSESMAGRAAVFQMLPLSGAEVGAFDVFLGGYPEVRLRPRSASLWFSSYLQTYLERDVRAITAVRDLALFRRFLSLLATRNGSLLNRTDLAVPLGVSIPTISQWLGVLETTGVILLVPPYFENLGKRLVKSPKLYFVDSGLVCHLLGMDRAGLGRSPLMGNVFEGFVASEIVKAQIHAGRARALYFFRDQQGLEVDFVIPGAGGEALLVEVKHGRTVTAADARPVQALAPRFAGGARGVVVHRGPTAGTRAVAPGVTAMSVEDAFVRGSLLGP